MDLLWWKVGSIFLMFLLVLFGGFLPTQLHVLAKNKREFALALGNAFSGGVFLCVGLVHLLPEASKQIESLRLGINDTLPISCTVALCGFLLIFCIEKIFLASSGTEENRAIAAIQSSAASRNMDVDVIVVPRQLIPHYHFYKRSRTMNQSSRAARSNSSGMGGRSTSHPDIGLINEGGSSFAHVERGLMNRVWGHYGESDEEHRAHEDEHIKLLSEASGHEHHHIHLDTNYPLVPYILALVLSVHSIIEGMALGIGENISQTIILIIALASHKWIEAFAFSTSFVKEAVPIRRWIGILVLYSLMTPVGITIGIFLADNLSGDNATLAEGLLESLAAGSFLYVSLVDIICEEFNKPVSRIRRYSTFAVMLLGIGLIVGVLFWNELDL